MTTHLIGLLLGTEEDWSGAFEEIVRRAALSIDAAGDVHRFETERVTIEPFDLGMRPRHAVVIDRLAHWYYHPREWLKKVALMDGTYLLNNPFTFQSMEKHAAYCAMMRLGLKVPETWLIPPKQPLDNVRWAYTSARYNRPFDLPTIAERIGYPLFMKPFDGGAWVGVSRIDGPDDLEAAYDESGQRLMHLQRAVDGFDVFARSLSIGAETKIMRFDPSRPLHARYQVDHGFLDAAMGRELEHISRTVNAFFRWEFNSCEVLVEGANAYPIDYANACPDVSLTSLHYYFPWAITALVKWSVFCAVTGRRMRIAMDPEPWFEVADGDAPYEEKVAAYGRLADEELDRAAYDEFCATHLGRLDDVVHEYVDGADFDRLLVDTVRATFPAHEHDHFVDHYRGLLAAWAKEHA